MPVVQLRALQNVVVRARALEDARAFIYVATSSAGDCTGNKIINGGRWTEGRRRCLSRRIDKLHVMYPPRPLCRRAHSSGVPLALSARYTTTNTPGSVHNTALDALCIRERREDPGSAASSTATATTAASTSAALTRGRLSICPLPGDPRLEDNVAKTVTKLLQSRRDDALRIGAMTDRRAPRIGTAVEEATTSNSTLASTSISTSRPVRPSCSAATNASTRACTAYPNGTAPYTQAVHPRFATYALTRHLARPRAATAALDDAKKQPPLADEWELRERYVRHERCTTRDDDDLTPPLRTRRSGADGSRAAEGGSASAVDGR
ncbi:hypothetical protein C8R45DRAFT_1081606 [Mycena sanguinolenta]|nr:hypothetical protein C8R45DRAFT_1081606 [Mycena sanguinolenta]